MTIDEHLITTALLGALIEAEGFISGFEGDDMQEPSVDPLLARIRAAILKAAGNPT